MNTPLSGHHLLETIDDCRNHIREVLKRWDNRLAIEKLCFVEGYIQKGLAVVCDLEFSRRQLDDKGLPLNRLQNGLVKNLSCLMVCSREVDNPQNGQAWDDKLMLVQPIESVQGPDGIIPSFVRLYIVKNDGFNGVRKGLWFSSIEQVFKLIPFLMERKIGHGVSGQVPDCNVQCSAQVVNSIPNDGAPTVRDGAVDFELDEIISSFNIAIMPDRIEVGFGESSQFTAKLRDVMIGPFNL